MVSGTPQCVRNCQPRPIIVSNILHHDFQTSIPVLYDMHSIANRRPFVGEVNHSHRLCLLKSVRP
jgi:hypothetical protein